MESKVSMKINSRFNQHLCLTCKRASMGQGNVPDKPWTCVFCETMICVLCFWEHTKRHDTERDKEVILEGISSRMTISFDPPSPTLEDVLLDEAAKLNR